MLGDVSGIPDTSPWSKIACLPGLEWPATLNDRRPRIVAVERLPFVHHRGFRDRSAPQKQNLPRRDAIGDPPFFRVHVEHALNGDAIAKDKALDAEFCFIERDDAPDSAI